MNTKIITLLQIAKEKGLPQKDVVAGIAVLKSGAIMEAVRVCGISPEQVEKAGDIDPESVSSEEELVQQLDAIYSSDEYRFSEVFNKVFDKYLGKYIQNIEK